MRCFTMLKNSVDLKIVSILHRSYSTFFPKRYWISSQSSLSRRSVVSFTSFTWQSLGSSTMKSKRLSSSVLWTSSKNAAKSSLSCMYSSPWIYMYMEFPCINFIIYCIFVFFYVPLSYCLLVSFRYTVLLFTILLGASNGVALWLFPPIPPRASD